MQHFKAFFLVVFSLMSFTLLKAQPEVQEQLALQYYQNGEYEKAADLYEKIYQRKPQVFYYNYYLSSLFAIEDYEKAEKFVKSLSRKEPDNLRYKVELGYIYKRMGNERKAKKLFNTAIKKLPKKRSDYLALSAAFQYRDLYDLSLKVLEMGKTDFNPPLYEAIADQYFAQGKYQEMISTYMDMITENASYINLVKGKLQMMIAGAGNQVLSDALRTELLRRTQKYPSQTIYSELLYWFSIQKREFALALIQAKALDRKFNENGERVYQLSNILISNKAYDKAADGLKYIIQLGEKNRFYRAAEINLLRVNYLNLLDKNDIQTSEITQLVKDYESTIKKYGKNPTTVELMKNLAYIQAFHLHDFDQARNYLEEILEMRGVTKKVKANAKLLLGDILLFEGKKWTASLQYKQVEKEFKNDPIGFEAKFKAAKFYYYVGEMEWSKTQLDVLKGATSKLIANDAMELSLLISENIDPDSSYSSLSYFARADLLFWQRKYESALQLLDSIELIFPNYSILPNVNYQRALIYMEQKNHDSAQVFFKKTFTNFPYASIADNALIKLARLLDEELHNASEAQKYYEKILLDYPGSLFTVEARKRYEEIKNKN